MLGDAVIDEVPLEPPGAAQECSGSLAVNPLRYTLELRGGGVVLSWGLCTWHEMDESGLATSTWTRSQKVFNRKKFGLCCRQCCLTKRRESESALTGARGQRGNPWRRSRVRQNGWLGSGIDDRLLRARGSLHSSKLGADSNPSDPSVTRAVQASAS